jgi:DNA-directed RNA polymerase specialized sigma24 family protein
MVHDTKNPDPLALLANIRKAKDEILTALAQLRADERWAIDQARAARVPWEEIADATGAANGNAARVGHSRGA